MNSAIDVIAASKYYKGAPALAGISINIAAGQTTGLIGVNGAGKTTLFRCILDLQEINAGSIRIFEVDHRRPHARINLAYLPERLALPPYSTGRESLRLLCRLHGVEYLDSRAQLECDLLDFNPHALNSRVDTYSRGMTQKLGLIGCLLSDRPLLLLDEPMSGLDPKAHELFRRRLVQLKDEGKTLFFSTHALADAAALCDSLVLLHRGKVLYSGTVDGLLQAESKDSLCASFFAAVGVDRQ